MNHVRGPFIEYECTKCGRTVQENAPRDSGRLVDRIADANAKPETRICAACALRPDPGLDRVTEVEGGERWVVMRGKEYFVAEHLLGATEWTDEREKAETYRCERDAAHDARVMMKRFPRKNVRAVKIEEIG